VVQSINRDATLRLAKSSAESNVRCLIYISSIRVLGNATMDGEFTNDTASIQRNRMLHLKWKRRLG